MDDIGAKATATKGRLAPSSLPTDSQPKHRLLRAKCSFGQFVRNTIHHRRPQHKRANSTGKPGFVIQGERPCSGLGDLQRWPSRNSIISIQSRRSVLSIRSVALVGETPSILVTLPTARGRQARMLHHGSPLAAAPAKAPGNKRLRYSHPTASAVILPAEDFNRSMASLLSDQGLYNNDSRLGTPKTIDLSRDFPGEVNLRKIARDSSYGWEDAKRAVDGLKPRMDTSSNTLPVSSTTHDGRNGYKAYSRHSMDTDASVQQNRLAALDALNGALDSSISSTSSRHALPTFLLPGPPRMFAHLSMTDSLTSTNGGATFFDDDEAVMNDDADAGASRPQLRTRDSLGFIPYSKFLAREKTLAARNRDSSFSLQSTSEKEAAQALRHRQVYASVENLRESFPSFDESLSAAMLEVPVAQKAALKTPEAHNMNGNGFPVMKSPRSSYTAEPRYEKRSLTGDELKALKKAEKRQARLANPEKKAREAARSDARSTILGRMRQSMDSRR